MSIEIDCPIWGENHKATLHSQWVKSELTILEEDLIDSPRTGGLYRLTPEAFATIHHGRLKEKQKAKLTTWLFDKRKQGTNSPVITTDILDSFAYSNSTPSLSRSERDYRLLQFLVNETENIGDQINVSRYGEMALVISESVGWLEVFFLLRHLNDQGFVEYSDTRNPSKCIAVVTVKGYDRIEEIESSLLTNDRPIMSSPSLLASSKSSSSILLVHGQDNETKQEVARLIEKQGLEVIILDEQPSKGRTLIDKFVEEASRVGFAVVLLTPDDEGRKQGTEDRLNPRARQNVIFEMGFVSASLGRNNVCALLKRDIEIPSDYNGVVYISLEDNDWKLKLIKELKAAGFSADANLI